ncbi:hypothetical protein L226DRAFT_613635 [Lentinus tigrinus ALCF2SS1-7]|uniref:uncharacterized protein n=1 Tax=Lentinus tigrinus ALCF2SS1-7 TaxID=1328758 RepID=UPI001166047E|nr:hypothetical protein L226DRAFT_613635 [Lentinus tigrinus ALCF2SS1-7]
MPELASHVVQLTLEDVRYRGSPPDIFRKLTNVKHFYLASALGGPVNLWASTVISMNRSSMEQITLQDCFLPAKDFLFWSPRVFPKLKALHVLNFIQPNVIMLSLGAPSTQPHRSLSALKLRLDCGSRQCTTIAAFRQLFQDVGPNLCDLDIGFGRVEGPFVGQDVWQRRGMPFDHCINLRRLTLEHSVMEPNKKGCLGHLDHAPMLLATLRAPELRYIKLVVRQSYKVKENGAQTWGRIAHVLSGARFASVHGVRVCLADGQGNRKVVSWVKQQLRALNGRRPVDVVLVDNPRVDGPRTGTAQGPRASRQIQERPTRLG